MNLLLLISWPYVRRHGLRSILTAFGIVLGVALFFSLHTANQSVLDAFHNTVDQVAGSSQLQITTGDSGFDENILDQVQSVPGVRAAVPIIEAVANTGLKGQGSLLILGIDMTADSNLREYKIQGTDEDIVSDPLVFLSQRDSIVITNIFAGENNLHAGSQLALDTTQGNKLFTVRGIMKSGGLASVFGGNLALMDVYAAQRVFGRDHRFDRIDLTVDEGLLVETMQRRLTDLLGAGFQIDRPATRGEQFDSLVRTYSIFSHTISGFALFVGLFVIYNTFEIAVTQRRSEIGILRVLGATGRQIRLIFLSEGLVIGLIGSLVGVSLGISMARVVTKSISRLLGQFYGLPADTEEISINSLLVATSIIIGVATSVIAAWIPAVKAAHVLPIKALKKGKYQQFGKGERWQRRIIATAFAVLAIVCWLFSSSGWTLYLSNLLVLFAVLLMTPTLTTLAAKALRPLLKWLRPVEGTLAADSTLQAPRRASGVVSALMLSLMIVIVIGGVADADYAAIRDWANLAFTHDLFISPTANLSSVNFQFPGSIVEELRSVPGIAAVEAVHRSRVVIRGTPIVLVAADIGLLQKWGTLPVTQAPIFSDAYRLVADGKGVFVSEIFARLRGYQLGEIVEIPSPDGLIRLPIVEIVRDFSDQQGCIFIDRHLYIQHWHDSNVSIIGIYLNSGISDLTVKHLVLEKFSSEHRVFVLANRDLREYILSILHKFFTITYLPMAIAVLVAVFGIVNTLTVSIIDRRQQLGVLRAIGARPIQIRWTIWLEALMISSIGLLLGVGLGGLQLLYVLDTSLRDVGGAQLAYQFPASIALILVPITWAAAFIAAIGPSESVIHGSVAKALEYE